MKSHRSKINLLAGFSVIILLSAPMIFTTSGMAEDWANHLWYLWQQSKFIRHDHMPSLFLNAGPFLFYPIYAFYGGTIYAISGALTLALGNSPIPTYITFYIL